MLDKLGVAGAVGVLAVVAGLVVLGMHSLYAAAGVALVLAGLALVAKGLVSSLLGAFGMG